MKKLLLTLLGIQLQMFTYGQIDPYFNTPLTEDSLTNLFISINDMGLTELKKIQESYRYKSRLVPTEQNKSILFYIDDKLKAFQ